MSNTTAIRLLSIGFFFIFLGFDGGQQFLIALLESRGDGFTGLLSLFLLYVSFFGTSLVAPQLITKLGIKRSLILGSLPYWIFLFAVALEVPLLIEGMSVLVGIAAAFLWNASGQLIGAWSTGEKTAKAFSMQYTALLLGGFVGAVIAGPNLAQFSIAQIFCFFGGVGVLGSLCFVFLPEVVVEPAKGTTESHTHMLKNPIILTLIPLVAANYYVFLQGSAAVKLIALTRFGLEGVGNVGIGFRFAALIGAVSSGVISNTVGPAMLLRLLGILGFVAVATMVFVEGQTWFVLGSVLLGFFCSFVYPVTLTYLKGQFSDAEYGNAVGAFHVVKTAGLLAPVALNLVLSPSTAMMLPLVVLGVAVGALFFLPRDRDQGSAS